MTTPSEELKPCPFCGSADIDSEGVSSIKKDSGVGLWKDAKPEHIEHHPACNNCSATTNGAWNTRSDSQISEKITDSGKRYDALNVDYNVLLGTAADLRQQLAEARKEIEDRKIKSNADDECIRYGNTERRDLQLQISTLTAQLNEVRAKTIDECAELSKTSQTKATEGKEIKIQHNKTCQAIAKRILELHKSKDTQS